CARACPSGQARAAASSAAAVRPALFAADRAIDPLAIGGDVDVDARIFLLGAAGAPTGDADEHHAVVVVVADGRAAAVALAGVGEAAAGAEHALGDGAVIGFVAGAAVDGFDEGIKQRRGNRALLGKARRAPSEHGDALAAARGDL